MAKSTDQSQGEIAYAALIDALRTGVFGPGDRLREEDVSRRLALSRTPVREALRRLEPAGLVEHRARSGAVVRTLSHAEVVELYEMRFVLERTAAELSARHATEAELDTLAALNLEIAAAAGAPAAAVALNQKFHATLYASARNRFLVDSAAALTHALLLLGPSTLADTARVQAMATQHEAILNGLRARDPAAAGAAARAHLEASLRVRLSILAGR